MTPKPLVQQNIGSINLQFSGTNAPKEAWVVISIQFIAYSVIKASRLD